MTASAFTITATRPCRTFTIDETALHRWVSAEGDELAASIPGPGDDAPASTLSDLVRAAQTAGVLTGDPSLDLDVHGDDHYDGSGYLVLLHNRAGDQRLIGLCGGWTELRWLPAGTSAADGARQDLEEVCEEANQIVNALAEG